MIINYLRGKERLLLLEQVQKMKYLFFLLLVILFCSCAPIETEQSYSPYFFVEAASNATATPTPFQPSGHFSLPVSTGLRISAIATATPLPTGIPQSNLPEIITKAQPQIDTSETVNILLLGADSRNGSSFRTDTILIAIIRPKDGQVSLISIPRDLWVNIPTVGMQRINTAYEYGEISDYPGGGAGLLKDTIMFNLGIRLDYTSMVDFDGFRKIVDTIGGIDLPISCPYTDWRLLDPTFDPEEESNWFLFTVGPGIVHMNGDLSLWYARSRKLSNDFDRGRRQQEVIRSIYGQILKSNLIEKIPALYTDLSSTVTSDLLLGDILKLAPLGLHLSNADIRSYYISGDLVTSWITPGGAYVLLPNIELIQKMIETASSKAQKSIGSERIIIEIQNGSSSDGWDVLAAERLNYAGYKTTFNNADNRFHTTSLLYDLTTEQDRTKTARLLAILGLPETALVSVPSLTSKVSYALIVGDDFSICFDPIGLAP